MTKSRPEKYPLRGVVVSLNTPYDDAGAVDLDALARLVDWHIGQGAAGFLAPAYAGEVYDLGRPLVRRRPAFARRPRPPEPGPTVCSWRFRWT